MGAGAFGAGTGPCGADPVYVPAPPPVLTLPAAALYDPAVKGFSVQADGTVKPIHPVDQRVALLCFIARGSVPSAPTLGNRFRARIARVDPARIPAIALDEFTTVLRPLISAGDILLLSVTTLSVAPGSVQVFIAYVNLRDPATNPRYPLANARRISVS